MEKPKKDDKQLTKELQKEGEEIFQNVEFANVINSMKINYKNYLEQIILYNTLRKAKYDSLIKLGFDEKFAQEIILKVDLFK